MIGRVKPQASLYDVGNVFDFRLKPGSFYAQLAEASQRLFTDDMFADFYSKTLGRPSVPPSQLAIICVLQAYEGLSDEAAVEHTSVDLRWAAILHHIAGTFFCAKSTLQLFRSHLVIHKMLNDILSVSIAEARQSGLLKGELALAIDTKPMIGRGAVKDTYNLLADGIVKLARQLAKESEQTLEGYLKAAGMGRYAASSIKGNADIDWSDDAAANALLTQIVADAKLLLARAAGGGDKIRNAASLLCSLLLQDVEESVSKDGGSPSNAIKKGTSPGRIPSTTDPEQRHGRKSKSHRFTGSKSSVATDVDSKIITAADVISGDAPDNQGALELVQQTEVNTGLTVTETMGDCAYGDGGTRQKFEDAGRTLVAKVPKAPHCATIFPKSRFTVDLENNTVTCPAGHTTTQYSMRAQVKVFDFGRVCNCCPLRLLCTESKRSRRVQVHPQERLLHAARTFQQTDDGRKCLRRRVAVEHALARLSHLGISQARYIGHAKSRFQLIAACAVANLRRTWNWVVAQTSNQPGMAAI